MSKWMLKILFVLSIFVTISNIASAESEDYVRAPKYYTISVGCWPKYVMHNVRCEVGTTWQDCAKADCHTNVAYPPRVIILPR